MTTKIAAISTGIYQINTWIVYVTEKKVLVIDPATSELTGDSLKIVDFLKKNNLQPVAFILTHGHFDHIAGTLELKKTYPNIPLICHKEDAFMVGSNAVTTQGPVLIDMEMEYIIQMLENLPDPDILVSKETTLDKLIKTENRELKNQLSTWKILHTPGHTKGCICLYNANEKLLFSGDTIFYHSYGRTDLPGGNQAEMIKTLNRIYTTLPKDTRIFPGHDYSDFILEENI